MSAPPIAFNNLGRVPTCNAIEVTWYLTNSSLASEIGDRELRIIAQKGDPGMMSGLIGLYIGNSTVSSGHLTWEQVKVPPGLWYLQGEVQEEGLSVISPMFPVVVGRSTACTINVNLGGHPHRNARIGGAVGGVVLLLLIVLGIVLYRRRSKSRGRIALNEEADT